RPRGEFPGGARRLSPEGRGLVVQGLTKTYGKLVAVDQLFFEVKPGEILALLGPNGAGQTTSLLCLAGLLRPDAGRIELDRQILGPQRGSRIAVIPETAAAYDLLTVWEHMAYGAPSCRLAELLQERERGSLEDVFLEITR